jgi:hypothetical protein
MDSSEAFFQIFVPILLIVGIVASIAVRLTGSIFSLRIRNSIARHWLAHMLWLVGSVLAILILVCWLYPLVANRPRMAEQDVIRVAKAEMIARFPQSVATNEDYHAEFRGGTWSVSGTAPSGMRGGGALEATVRDSDGKVTDVHLGR